MAGEGATSTGPEGSESGGQKKEEKERLKAEEENGKEEVGKKERSEAGDGSDVGEECSNSRESGAEDDEEMPSAAAPASTHSSTSAPEESSVSPANATPTSTAALVAKQMPSSSRVMRNLAEKMRRDKLNTYIGELATLVPMVSSSPRRLDKTSVLRLSATYLRMHRTLHPSDGSLRPFLPKALKAFNLSEKVLEEMDGFLIVMTGTGKIIFVTHSVEKLLGHTQNDLLGQSMYGITHADDHKLLRKNLSLDADGGSDVESSNDELGYSPKFGCGSPMEIKPSMSLNHCTPQGKITDTSCSSGSCPSSKMGCWSPMDMKASMDSPHPASQDASKDPSCSSGSRCSSSSGSCSKRLSFYLRMSQRAVGRGETAGYEVVHIVGQLRTATADESQSNKDLGQSQSSSSGTSLPETVMVGVARICRERQILELSLMDACKDEYLTRHGIHGEIITCDHRISVIAGYLADEVKGHSAFSFMHDQDARWTYIALQNMFNSKDGVGNSCYRLKSKTGQFIYLRTHGYCEFDRVTGKFDTFVCINSLVSEEEGKKAVDEMRQRYSASISGRNVVSRALMDVRSARTFNGQISKALKALPSKAAIQGTLEESVLESEPLPSTSGSLTQSSSGKALHISLEHHSSEVILFESTQEERLMSSTPKSFGSSTPPPPPLISCSPTPSLVPVSCPSSSPPPPPYVFNDPAPPLEVPPAILPYASPKTTMREMEKNFSSRETSWLPGAHRNSVKRPPPSSSPPLRPPKRSHLSISSKVDPTKLSTSQASWPPMECHEELNRHKAAVLQMPSGDQVAYEDQRVGGVGLGRALRGICPQRVTGESTTECGRLVTFPEDERHLLGWACDEMRPATVDLSLLDRNSEFPDLRDDVEQLDIFSMQVEPELTDPRRWDLIGESQIQELDGSIVVPDGIVGTVDDQSVEDTIHGGIRRSHRRLRLRLDSQGCTMASIERDLAGLAGNHTIGGDLARLRVERKKQMHMLHSLEQEHRSSIPTQDKTKVYGMQNVGV